MSRAAVVELLGDDVVLSEPPYNISERHIFPTYTMQGSRRPPVEADNYFLVLRWEEMIDTAVGDVQICTVWAHRSRSAGTNFHALRTLLFRVREVLTSANNVLGADGDVLSQARFQGMGPDLADEGYDTFTKYAIFEINTKVGS